MIISVFNIFFESVYTSSKVGDTNLYNEFDPNIPLNVSFEAITERKILETGKKFKNNKVNPQIKFLMYVRHMLLRNFGTKKQS